MTQSQIETPTLVRQEKLPSFKCPENITHIFILSIQDLNFKTLYSLQSAKINKILTSYAYYFTYNFLNFIATNLADFVIVLILLLFTLSALFAREYKSLQIDKDVAGE